MATPRRSKRLASEEPEHSTGLAFPEKQKRLSALEVDAATTRVLHRDRDFVLDLTASDRAATINNRTTHHPQAESRAAESESRVAQLEQEVAQSTARAQAAEAAPRRKRNLHDDVFHAQIQQKLQERRAAAAASSHELQLAIEDAKLTPASQKSSAQQKHNITVMSPTPQEEQEMYRDPQRTAVPQQGSSDYTLGSTTTSPQERVTATSDERTEAPPATPFPAWRGMIGAAASYLSPFGRRPSSQKLIIGTAPQSASAAQRSNTVPLGELTPATRKRSAEEDTNTVRPAKRATPAPRPVPAEPQTPSERQPQVKRRKATPASNQQLTAPSHDQAPVLPQSAPAFQQRVIAPSNEQTPTFKRKRSIAPPEEDTTPHAQKTPRHFLMPSAKNRRVPTSLSTVIEYFEPGNSFLTTTTPSKPQRRTAASARASRLAYADTPSMEPLSWEKRAASATPAAPKDTNADRRFQKLERYRMLQRELQRLNQDEEIMEMASHRRKRVKVDTLAYIPHNRPGESSGTFRVPDIDSDDEMEVDETVPERTNVFEEAAKQQEDETEGEEEPEFVFPSVGKRDPADVMPDDEVEQCRLDFVRDFAAWRVRMGVAQ